MLLSLSKVIKVSSLETEKKIRLYEEKLPKLIDLKILIFYILHKIDRNQLST